MRERVPDRLDEDGRGTAMNARDEEWGEERIIAAVQRAGIVPPAELIRILMREADAFVDGAPQHDDMTLIVIRVI